MYNDRNILTNKIAIKQCNNPRKGYSLYRPAAMCPGWQWCHNVGASTCRKEGHMYVQFSHVYIVKSAKRRVVQLI